MPGAGQYQGSQAFAQNVLVEQEAVNPNTGSLNFKLPIVNTCGVRPSIDLTVQLFYAAGHRGTFGLPRNWGFNLPYVLNEKSLTTADGASYAIDPNWTASNRTASGLRYVNQKGIKFESFPFSIDLPCGRPGSYRHVLKHADGSRDFFDANGKPLEHRDVFGNWIYYSYASGKDSGIDSDELRLGYIEDSWRQHIVFQYMPGSEIIITLPDASKTTITFSPNGVALVEDSVKRKTRFDYVPFNGYPILSSIEYPTGLTSRYDYLAIEFLDQNEKRGSFPAVRNHYYLDMSKSETKDKILRQVQYTYGMNSSRTFTGAAIGVRMGGLVDSLMDGYGSTEQYRYDVLKRVYDAEENKMAMTHTIFNSLHAPVSETRFLLDSQNQFIEAFQSLFTFSYLTDTRQRSPNYNKPSVVEVLRNVAPSGQGTPLFQPLSRQLHEYDDFGALTSSSTDECAPGSSTYQNKSCVVNEYTLNEELDIQLLTTTSTTDKAAQTEYRGHSILTTDKKAIASTVTSYRSSLDTGVSLEDWHLVEYTYDPEGRILSETKSWAPGFSVPENSITSTQFKTAYVFQDGFLTVSTTDASGHITKVRRDMRRPTGPVVQRTLPLGQSETFEFDGASRLISHTNALGHVTVTHHSVGSGGNSEMVTSPVGYTKLTTFDVLGREIEVTDNGDPTQPSVAKPTRMLSRKKYDALSRVCESTDRFGLISTYTYDALDRILSVFDPKGNVVKYQYDDKLRQITQFINEEKRHVTTLDSLSRAVSTETYPDSGNSSTDYCLVSEITYDLNNRTIRKLTSQRSKAGVSLSASTPLREETFHFGPGSCMLSRQVTGFEKGQQDTVKRRYTHDLFGNVYSYNKTTLYADGRSFENHGPIQLYDINGRLCDSVNQNGQKEHREYDANGRVTRIIRYDGSTVKLSYDEAGRVVEKSYPRSTTKFVFDEDSNLSRISQGEEKYIAYEYSKDATMTKVTYADGKSQAYTLDSFSRIIRETDVFGVMRDTEYNNLGAIVRRSCQGDTVTYDYGMVNHAHGECLGYHMSGQRTFAKVEAVDGFGRKRQTIVTAADSSTLLDTKYYTDSHGRVRQVTSSSPVSPKLTYETVFDYDGMGQLVSEQHDASKMSSVTKYTYDGNANIISRDINGVVTNMTYNKIDQRTDSGFTYDTNGRLITDDVGKGYLFDEQDRLISVQTASEQSSQFAYHANNLLSEHTSQDAAKSRLFYNRSKVNAMEETTETGSSQTSLLQDEKTIFSSYDDKSPPSYYFDSLKSTSLVLQGDKHISSTFNAYGAKNSPARTEHSRSCFGFAQEFSDLASGLIYLRSRYYNPSLMSFVSMDSQVLENRYSYCEGDPVNRVDPSGNAWAWWQWAGLGIGIGVGLAVAGWLTGPMLAAAGITGLGAGILNGALSAAVGAVARSFWESRWNGNEEGFVNNLPETLWQGALGGAVSGGVAHFVGPMVGNFAQQYVGKELASYIASAGGGAAGAAVSYVARSVANGEALSGGEAAFALLMGFFVGALVAGPRIQGNQIVANAGDTSIGTMSSGGSSPSGGGSLNGSFGEMYAI